MKCFGFQVTPVHFPSGRTAWAVSGSINGTQIRRRFSDRGEAEVFRDENDAILFGKGHSKPPVRTHLSDAEVQEAEAATALLHESHPEATLFDAVRYFSALSRSLPSSEVSTASAFIARLTSIHPGRTLSDALEYYIAHYQPAISSKSLNSALVDYLLERQRECEKRSLSKRQFESIGFELARLEKHFTGEVPLTALTSTQLHEYLKDTFPTKDDGTPSYSNKSWNNRRGLLTTFFGYCIQRGWLHDNPAQKIRVFRRTQLAQQDIAILDAKKAGSLMSFVEGFQNGRMVPFFAITLFAGVRPDWKSGEISKLTSENFVTDEKYIRLPRAITKTKKKRHTVIQPNLAAWLKAYPIKKYPIICANFKKLYPRIRKQFGLTHDVLRHTYCSMLVGKYRSVSETALQAGNSERVLWESYLDLVQKPEAERFWNIGPEKNSSESYPQDFNRSPP